MSDVGRAFCRIKYLLFKPAVATICAVLNNGKYARYAQACLTIRRTSLILTLNNGPAQRFRECVTPEQ